ncbi:hypothetical protein MtrunA17_Chr8g0357571 [Medicago truncatula]|uniref:Transmembrane protein, putative n=1 Tax=Medicago truncatula TaxID=3880 RepID=G7ZX54_MEDTR|nr:transmembrane protein, putative [Medicago truncatula]RHN40692.1 hypothetical protein MtrunA17_Chr8g0357571 [Medicago truncatula]
MEVGVPIFFFLILSLPFFWKLTFEFGIFTIKPYRYVFAALPLKLIFVSDFVSVVLGAPNRFQILLT